MIVLGESWVPIFESHFHLSPLGIRASLALSLTWLRPKSDSLILNMAKFTQHPNILTNNIAHPSILPMSTAHPFSFIFRLIVMD